uniref:(California timema) hypothetical protein n=1 Tax=Timema californicum TaxID=61474 RepID=A0A7R9J2I8_TIMCA|nr:unnamed protein product [Timema californicum]
MDVPLTDAAMAELQSEQDDTSQGKAGVKMASYLEKRGKLSCVDPEMPWPSLIPGLNRSLLARRAGNKDFRPTKDSPRNSPRIHKISRAGESYTLVILSLRHLAANRSFGTFLDDALKSQFYQISLVRVKIRNEEGNFSSLVALANRYEILGPDIAPTNASDNTNIINAVHPYQQKNKKFKKKFQSSQRSKPQLSSGPNHQPSQSALCAGCGSKIPLGIKVVSVKLKRTYIQCLSKPTTACDLYVVNSNRAPAHSSAQLEVNGVPLTMEVDTAASASFFGEPVYLAHFKHLPLAQSATLPLVVVWASFPSLLGISWISHIHLDWNAIFSINYFRRSKQISTSLLRLRDPKAVPVELSWEMVKQAMPALVPTPTSDGPTPGHLIQPHPVADRSLPASPAPEPSTDSTPEALRQAPSVMAPAHTPVRPAALSPSVSAPLSSLVKLITRGCPSNN